MSNTNGEQRKRNRRLRRISKLYRILTCVCVAIFGGCMIWIGVMTWQNEQVRRTNQALSDAYERRQTAEPETSETADVPEVTPVVEVTPLPDVTATPDVTVAPDVIVAPDVTTAPDVTVAPDVTTAPDVTVAPDVIAAPDVTTAPDVIVSMTVAADNGANGDWPIAPVLTGVAHAETVTETPPRISEDFLELYEQNAELIGWLIFNGQTGLPVVQRDNEFYMEHDYHGAKSDAGTLFLDENNGFWPADDQLIIYGHNMMSGSMFGMLPYYRKAEHLKKYPLLEFRTIYDEETQYYVPIALFDASMNEDNVDYFSLLHFNFDSDAEKLAYIEEIRARSLFDIPIETDANDQLLTLVTCSYFQDNGRFLLFARKVRANEDIATMRTLVQSARAN